MSNKEFFLNLLGRVDRDGMGKLIEFLEKTDFFTAPASTRFHGAYQGGLLQHSINVRAILSEEINNDCYYPRAIEDSQKLEDTVTIVSLLHDVCKVNYYAIEMRNKKNEKGEWVKEPFYTVKDTIPYGHGEKSVMILNNFIRLTAEEMYAIRWHMGAYEPKELYGTLAEAYNRYPLALALHISDLKATYLLEKEEQK